MASGTNLKKMMYAHGGSPATPNPGVMYTKGGKEKNTGKGAGDYYSELMTHPNTKNYVNQDDSLIARTSRFLNKPFAPGRESRDTIIEDKYGKKNRISHQNYGPIEFYSPPQHHAPYMTGKVEADSLQYGRSPGVIRMENNNSIAESYPQDEYQKRNKQTREWESTPGKYMNWYRSRQGDSGWFEKYDEMKTPYNYSNGGKYNATRSAMMGAEEAAEEAIEDVIQPKPKRTLGIATEEGIEEGVQEVLKNRFRKLPSTDVNLNLPQYQNKDINTYGFMGRERGNVMAGAGADFGKVGATAFGITPGSSQQRKYWPGTVSAGLNYDINPNLNVSGEMGYSPGNITPKVGMKMRFAGGGKGCLYKMMK